MKVTNEHLFPMGKGRWKLIIKPNPNTAQIRKWMKAEGSKTRAGNPPAEVLIEAQKHLAKVVLGHKEELKEAKLRKQRVPTLGEIISHYRNNGRIKNNLKKSSIITNINALTKFVAVVYGIETPLNQGRHFRKKDSAQTWKKALQRNSIKVSGSAKAAELRLEAVGSLPLTVLTGESIDRYIEIRMAEGPAIRPHEVRPDHLQSKGGELSGPDIKRIQSSIRTELACARGIFAHASTCVKNLICPIEGIYQKFRLPDSIMEFKKRYTFKKPGKVDYVVPTARELGKLWNGMPQLKEEQPEVYKGFKIGADTGLRLDELRFLMWDQFQERTEGVFITVKDNGANGGTKSGNERPVRISQGLYEELIDMETDETYVIGGTHEFRQWQLGKAIADYMRSKGWKRRLCVHELRKWFGAMVADRTKSLVAVMHILGHRSYSTTKGTYEALVEYPVYDDITATLPGAAGDPKPAIKKVA